MSQEESNAQEESSLSIEGTGESEDSKQEFADSSSEKGAQARAEIPDVTLDVPTLGLEEAHLQVDNLRARISLQSELADMVRINVGVDAFLEKVELDLKGLEAQALLKANLENVREILGRTLESLDSNPQLLESVAQLESSGKSLEGVAGDVGEDSSQKNQGEENEPEENESEDDEEVDATGAARSKADELGVDLSQVTGTGSGGRIIVKDVVKAARN